MIMLSKIMMELEKLQSNLGYSISAAAKIENIALVKRWISDNIAPDLWFPEYEEFLKRRDGLVIFNSEPNDGTKGFITANEIWRSDPNYSKYVYFGDTDISWFTYDLSIKKYSELDKPSSDFIESFDSFNDMLATAISRTI